MDKELKAKWIEALRSGQFKQTTGKLHRPYANSYCCLGVLSRIAGFPIDSTGYCAGGYRRFWEVLGGRKRSTKLWEMNDGGKSFAQIADYIEQNL